MEWSFILEFPVPLSPLLWHKRGGGSASIDFHLSHFLAFTPYVAVVLSCIFEKLQVKNSTIILLISAINMIRPYLDPFLEQP